MNNIGLLIVLDNCTNGDCHECPASVDEQARQERLLASRGATWRR